MGKRMTTEDFIQKANLVHNNIYNYTKVNYINTKTKVAIICKEHGLFLQTPAEHLRGSGCKECFNQRLRLTSDQFMQKAKLVHHNKYDYSLSKYKSTKEPIIITCKIHGPFKQAPYIHLNGSGCQICYDDTMINTTEKFINKANKIHNDRYDYSMSQYTDESTRIAIICKLHGVFHQRKRNHLSGAGCQKCAKDGSLSSTKEFIQKATEIHGDKYDYKLSDYKGSFKHITIICPNHGAFKQYPSNHLQGAGCRLCAFDDRCSTTDQFISSANLVHDKKYDYSKTKYIKAQVKVIITCPTHGQFKQKANNHLQGQGCPICPSITSKEQEEICSYINGLDIKTLTNDRLAAAPYEIDIYIPSFKLGIEYHGLYWHSYNQQETVIQKRRHQQKSLAAANKGIQLLQFFEHEWQSQKDIIKSMISYRLGISHKINARDLEISISHNPSQFYDENHLQRSRSAKHHISLINNQNEIIMATSFSKYRENTYELIRMATAKNYCVRGGISKIMNYYKKTINKPLLTYADLRYANARGYKAIGFVEIGLTAPGYFYYHENNKNILSRQRCQKHKLNKLLNNYDHNLTEAQNMFNNKYRRIWDAGHLKLMLY